MDAPSDNAIQHNARTHVSSDYILPADDEEQKRLDAQHKVMKAVFENRLFLAPVILKPGDRVLDSGTGAASWLLDLARDVPSTVAIYGVDISTRLFPAAAPPNAHLLAASITQLPAEWTATFALVNQRLLLGGLSAAAWQAALSEMHRVLAPGGWVNLFELNCDLGRFGFECGPAVRTAMALLREIFRSGNVLVDGVHRLAGWLETAGFTNIHTEVRRVPVSGEEGRPMRENLCRTYMAMKTPALKAGGYGLVRSEEEYDSVFRAYGEELAVTDGAVQPSYTIFAQKPWAIVE